MSVITPIENALQDTRSRETRFQNQLANMLAAHEYTNSSTTPVQNLEIKSWASSGLVDADNGFYVKSFTNPIINFLPNPSLAYRINAVKDINFTYSIFALPDDIGGYVPPVITAFSIDHYTSFLLLPTISGNIFFTAALEGLTGTRAFQIKTTFNFDPSDPLAFTITNNTQTLRLADTIVRGSVDRAPDFTVNSSQIDDTQYNLLTSGESILLSLDGFDRAQYTPLSANNKLLLNDLFNVTALHPFNLFGIGIRATMSYSGLLASFKPFK